MTATGKLGDKRAAALSVLAAALAFALYASAFEPVGAAEFAYIFAVPLLWCARALGLSKRLVLEPNAIGSESARARNHEAKMQRKRAVRAYLASVFVFSYLSWIFILVWLRHVYPPAGWGAVLLLPLVVSGLFIFPWFAVAPRMLPELEDPIWKRLVKLCGLAGLWVLLEWVRSWIFTGFPWMLLGHSQWLRIPIIQSASFGGVWFVSFTLIFFNLAVEEYFYRLYAWYKVRSESRFTKIARFGRFSPEFYLALLLVFSGVWLYISELPSKVNARDCFRVGFAQPNFPGILKWRDDLARENIRVVRALTLALGEAGVDLVLLPEAATPPRWPIIGSPAVRGLLENLSKRINAPMALGNMALLESEAKVQNGAFVIDPKDGLGKKFYAKTKLVPFGEYVPFWASWLGKVIPVGELKRGDFFEPLDITVKGKPLKMGNMICYEDVFPSLGLRAARNGADFIFVCTNDSWYGREGGAWQHAAHSALQAVSLRKPILRSSNNGLSCAFDQYGKMFPTITLKNEDSTAWKADTTSKPVKNFDIVDALGRKIDPQTLKPLRGGPLLDENGSIYFRGAGFADVCFYKNFDSSASFYARHGDWFVWACAFFAFFGAGLSFGKKSSIYRKRAALEKKA